MPIVRIAILAAGQASRFGANKLMQLWRGQPLLSYVLEAASRTCPGQVLVVTGADAETIAPVCAEFGADTVLNPSFASGIGTSIATAARACKGDADGMLLLLGDQPLVTAAHLGELIDLWNGDPERICASRYAGTQGPPVLFGGAYLARLSELNDDSGAKEVVTGNDRVIAIDFEPAAIDIDELDDLLQLDKFSSNPK
ncbi:MAG: nucleotidyltransferase family protein [Woeseiaceae bacterium]|nr:nucleotidyltransferase family protein [Woeseiaceae bacterium]